MNYNKNNALNCSSGQGRIFWVDFAKAIGVFLVFWGHTLLQGGSDLGNGINRAIYSFHMPMFFLLSGYVAKREFGHIKEFLQKRFRRIVLPALILYVITLPIYFIYNVDWSDYSVLSILSDIFYVHGVCAYNRPLWFFFCLFQVLLLSKILDLSNAHNTKLITVVLCCLFISYLFYLLKWKVFSIFGLNKCVIGLFFYCSGMLLRRLNYEKHIYIVCFFSLPLWVLTGLVLNTKVSMHDMTLGNFWLFIVSGLSGALVFFAFCKLFAKNERIREYAKWTVFIISSHYVLVSFFRVLTNKFSIGYIVLYDIVSFCFVIISFIIYKPICRWIEKHFPVLMGS